MYIDANLENQKLYLKLNEVCNARANLANALLVYATPTNWFALPDKPSDSSAPRNIWVGRKYENGYEYAKRTLEGRK